MKNNEIIRSFTKIENLFRKSWLITLMLYPIISTLTLLVGVFGSVFDQNNVFHTKEISVTASFSILIILWGLFYINYRCSYKKTGTKLLIYKLIASIPTFLGVFILVISRLHVVSIVAFSIVSWIILSNIVMFKINLKYKKIKQKTSIPV